jgi:hypothetical protein
MDSYLIYYLDIDQNTRADMKHVVIFTIIFVLLGIQLLTSQAPDILWTRKYGDGWGIASQFGSSVQQTTDGGYIITGSNESLNPNYRDVILIKTNSIGDTLWTKTFGERYYDEEGYSVQQTTDGGYIIAGSRDSFPFGTMYSDVWLIKTNSIGDTLWTKTFGSLYKNDKGNSVQQTTDGGYIITGWRISIGTYSEDVWLIKTDSSCDMLWTKTFGGSGDDRGESVQQTTDGGYIIAGWTWSLSAGWRDLWLIKTSSLGDTLWTKKFGGAEMDHGYSVQQTMDEGYIIAGDTRSFGIVNYDVWLIKTNSSGDTLWTKTFGGSSEEGGYSVQQTTDGGYIITGPTRSYGSGLRDVWLIKTDSSGDTLWTKTIGGSGDDGGLSVQQTIDGGYIITGWTDGEVWLIKTTPDVNKIQLNDDIITLDFSLQQNYPNPFNPTTVISWQLAVGSQVRLTIYNIKGQEVAELINEEQTEGYHFVKWDAAEFSSGIYLYRLQAGEHVETRKMVLMK